MNLKKAIAWTGLVVATAAVSPLAFAQDAGFYAGGAIGQSKISDACDGVPIACDDKDTAWKIFGGYQFTRNIGAEIGYVHLGETTSNGVISGVSVSAKGRVKGWELLGVGTLPIANNFSALFKLGIFRWDVDVSGVGTVPGFSAAAAASETGTDITFGLGLKYDFTRNIAARLEWQRYDSVGNSATTGKSDVDLFSLGVVFKF
jgi:OOP family OmpA-OmpF porin